MDSAQALNNFWSSFGWKAYDSSTVPSQDQNPEIPRITYDIAMSEFDYSVSLSASLWDRGYSWKAITEKAMEIYEYIGLGGRIIDFDGGKLWIRRGQPFSQRLSDEDDSIRRIYLNIEVEYFIPI